MLAKKYNKNPPICAKRKAQQQTSILAGKKGGSPYLSFPTFISRVPAIYFQVIPPYFWREGPTR